MNNTFRILLMFCLLTVAADVYAQFSIGFKSYTRLTDDRVGPTAGFGLHGLYITRDSTEMDGIFDAGFDLSIPQYFTVNASMDANDSATIPYTITVPANLKVADYCLSLTYGIAINPKKKNNTWAFIMGLRGQYRHLKVSYLESFNESAYSRYTFETSPRIPAALNLGITLGFGYLHQFKSFALYPHGTFGFGGNDWRGKHPWNFYPNYFELGLTLMYITSLD